MTDTKKIAIALVISLVAFAGIVTLNSETVKKQTHTSIEYCTPIKMTAKNIFTGEIREFNNECTLPFGWENLNP